MEIAKKNIAFGVMAWLFLIGALGGILWIVVRESSSRPSPTTAEQDPATRKTETVVTPVSERYETKADAKKSLDAMEQSISALDEDIE
jgi:hypothetical protein